MDEQNDEPGKALAKALHDATITEAVHGVIELYIGTGLGATAVGGVLGAVAPRLIEQVTKHRQRNRNWATEIALRAYPERIDIFKERLTSNVERVELFARVLEAAAPTTLDAKIIALGRVLAFGLEEGVDISEAFMLAAALADMEAAHAVVIQRIHNQPVAPEETRTNQDRGWDKNDIAQVMPEFNTTLYGVLATLSRHGLLVDMGRVTYPGSVGPTIWTIRPLGNRAVFLLTHDVDQLLREMQERN